MKLFSIISAAALAIIFLWSCGKSNPEIILTMTSTQGQKLLSNQNYIFLDVRTEKEYGEGHIPNSTHIPVGSLEARIGEIEKFKDKKIVVYCRSGNRSAKGTTILIKYGFEAVNLTGGMLQWKGPVNKN